MSESCAAAEKAARTLVEKRRHYAGCGRYIPEDEVCAAFQAAIDEATAALVANYRSVTRFEVKKVTAEQQSRIKKLEVALTRAIRALRFVDTPEGAMYEYSSLADQLDAVLTTVEKKEEDIPICPGCSEANGTNGWAVVRHDPPLCKTSAGQAVDALVALPLPEKKGDR